MEGFLQRTGIIPKYNEVKFFLLTLIFLLITSTNSEVRNRYLHDIVNKDAGVVLAILLVGIFLSFFYIISSKEIPKFSRMLLLFYALIVNLLVSIEAYWYISSYVQGWYIVFPFINAANAFIVAILFIKRTNIVLDASIVSKQSTYAEIIVGSSLVCVIFFVSQYVLNNYWAITFSICLVYATNLNEFINRVFIEKYTRYAFR